jgi:hypothetical protein
MLLINFAVKNATLSTAAAVLQASDGQASFTGSDAAENSFGSGSI